jgi:hypothetical protein
MKTLHEKRLIQLATHLICLKRILYLQDAIPPDAYLSFNDLIFEGEIHIPIAFEVFTELPFLFKEDWYTSSSDMPELIRNPEQDTISAVMHYFQLEIQDFTQLFCFGQQVEWGEILDSRMCNSATIGRNIVELIRRRRFKSDLLNINLN